MDYDIQTDLFGGTYEVFYSSIINPKQRLKFVTDNNDKDFIKQEIRNVQKSLIKSYLIGLSKSRRKAYEYYNREDSLKFDLIDKNIQQNFLDAASERLRPYVKAKTSLDALSRISEFFKSEYGREFEESPKI